MIRFIAQTCLGFILLSLLLVTAYRFLPAPFTPLMAIRGMEKEDASTREIEYQWKDLSSISGNMQLAVVCSEDQNFVLHNGIDFVAMEKAYKHNKKGKKIRGASTISQQTAKNLFLWPSRNYVRKAIELYFTGLMELLWTKRDIMQAYLNIIELGDGVYGVEAAAKRYFKKPSQDLSRTDAALMAVLLPAPLKYSAVKPGPFVRKRQLWVLTQMNHFSNEMTYDKAEFQYKLDKLNGGK